MRYRVFERPTGPRASYLVFGAGTFCTHLARRRRARRGAPQGLVRKCRSEISLGRDRETQMSDYALSSHLSERSCPTRQLAVWPSSQRQMFATVSW